jgi:hypothetical protein
LQFIHYDFDLERQRRERFLETGEKSDVGLNETHIFKRGLKQVFVSLRYRMLFFRHLLPHLPPHPPCQTEHGGEKYDDYDELHPSTSSPALFGMTYFPKGRIIPTSQPTTCADYPPNDALGFHPRTQSADHRPTKHPA